MYQVSIDARVDTRFMIGSASYARQHTGSHRIALGRFPEAVNNQNVVRLECSTLTPWAHNQFAATSLGH